MTAVVALVVALSTVASPPPDPGEWLANRARTYGLGVGSTPSVGQVEVMLVWLEAATRVSPTLANAHLARHDLLTLLNRGDEALEALGQYCEFNPADEARRLARVAGQFENKQTAEDRIDYCTTQLAEGTCPASVASELHHLLAQTYGGMGDLDLARQHVREALEANAFNFAARGLLLNLMGDVPSPEAYAAHLLASISASPVQWETMRSLAHLLDTLSLHEQAGTWYGYALRACERANPGRPLPASGLIDAATSARDGGKHDLALSLCQRALEVNPDSYDASLLFIDIARRAGQTELAEGQLSRMRAQLGATEERVRLLRDGLGAGRIAWFHTYVDPDAAKALQFAELAAAATPEDTTIQLTLGLALVQAQRWEEAQQKLGPLATGPSPKQFAVWGLARALLGLGQRDAALDMLRDAEQIRRSGAAYERVVELLAEFKAPPLPPVDHSKVLAGLEAFAPEVLRFPEQPGRYLSLAAEPTDPNPRYGQPWRCRFTLTNRGPFPITLGTNLLVSGQLLVSAQVHIPDFPLIEGYLPITCASRPVLQPGEHAEVEEALEVGPLVDMGLVMAQRELAVTFTVILDPVQNAEGKWVSSLGPDLVVTTRVIRHKVDYSPAGIQALTGDLRSSDPSRRISALRTAAGLLAERLLGMRTKLDYQPRRIDKTWLTNVLHAGLSDPNPVVRARAVECLTMLAWKDELAQAVAPLLSDPHWLVRLMVVDLLATRQGPVFSPVAGRLSEQDPDPLVRRLAYLHLERLQPRPTRPPGPQ